MIKTDDIFEILKMDDLKLKKNIIKYIDKSTSSLENLDEDEICSFLKNDTLLFNFYLNLVNYKLFKEEDFEFWNLVNDILTNHNKEFITNKNIYKDIKLSSDNFLKNFKNNMEIFGINNKKIKSILSLINKNEKNILNNLNSKTYLNLEKNLLSNINDNDNKKIKIELNFNNYYYLLNNISNANYRNKIEKLYNRKSLYFLNDICKLSILKNLYSKELGFNTYFNFRIKKNNECENIKLFIEKLILLIDEKSNLELLNIKSRLSKDGFEKKVNYNDIIYYHNKIQDKSLFKPKKVLNILFDVIEKFFFIKIKNIKDKNIFECIDLTNNKKIGNLILELSKKNNVESPTYIKLLDNYNDNNLLCSIILCNFDNFNSECMNYDQINKLFIEFGYLIKNLFDNFDELNNNDIIEYDELLPNIMGSLSYEKNIINKITEDNNITEHILFSKGIDFCINLKLKCLNILFDYTINSNNLFLKIPISEIEKDNESKCLKFKIFIIKYYKEFFSSNEKYFDCDLESVPLSLVYNSINGSNGLLFYNLLNEILSEKILKNLKKNKEEKIRFINLLKEKKINLRDKIVNYLNNYDKDMVELMKEYVLKYSNIDNSFKKETHLDFTEDTNFFDDKDSDSESDFENIINIKKNSTTTKKNII